MLGHLMEWFYSGLAGIRQQDDDTGFNKILIAPQFVNGIDWVKSYYNSINGKIEVSWKKEKGQLFVDITVPSNSSAIIVLPDNNPDKIMEGESIVPKSMIVKSNYAGEKEVTLSVLSGKYKFRMPYSNN